MDVSYDAFVSAFLTKIIEYDFVGMEESTRTELVDGYMRRAMAQFEKTCRVDLLKYADNGNRVFSFDLEQMHIEETDLDEMIEIISEGMVVQWVRPYVYQQENLERVLNTKDFTTYSPAELLNRIMGAYNGARKEFTNMMREYSYNHGDLTVLHL